MLNLTDDEERKKKMQGERRETQGKQFKTFRKRQILVWLGIEPTPNLIRKKSGKPTQCLVVKPLRNEAARAAPVEHSSHPRKGLMHRENVTFP